VAILPLPVVGRRRNRPGSVSSLWAWSKTPGLPSDIFDICHNVGDINTSGLDGHIAISVYPSMSHLFLDTFFEFGMVDSCLSR